MNPRERYRQALLFGAPDRIPLQPGVHRESTRAVWYEQGLPRDIPDIDIEEYAYREAGGQKKWPQAFRQRFPVSDRMIPQFEEKVLERRERTQIVEILDQAVVLVCQYAQFARGKDAGKVDKAINDLGQLKDAIQAETRDFRAF